MKGENRLCDDIVFCGNGQPQGDVISQTFKTISSDDIQVYKKLFSDLNVLLCIEQAVIVGKREEKIISLVRAERFADAVALCKVFSFNTEVMIGRAMREIFPELFEVKRC